MEEIEPEITKAMLIRAKKLALRTGKWYRLHPTERIILSLSCKILTRVKSSALKKIILKIFEKISEKLILSFKAIAIGYQIAKRRVEQAIKLGYYKALDWLRDFSYMWYLGWSHINTPKIYQV